MTTAADRIAAPGVVVDGAGGQPITLRYDFAALRRLEADYGTLAAAADALQAALGSTLTDFSTPVMDTISRHLAALTGLATAAIDGVFADHHPGDLVTRLAAAWVEAWPQPNPDAEQTEGKARRSRGSGSTGGRPSGSAAPTASSGG